MAEFGVALFVFFFCITGLTIQANLSPPVRLNEVLFLAIFVVYMLYVVWWLVRLVRGLRIPAAAA